jgi:acetyl esterase/lipase/rhodanese-related sulfurtransferase
MRYLHEIVGVYLVIVVAAPAGAQQAKARPLPDSVVAHLDLEYVKDGHARQRLDLYLPKQASAPLPVIVWVHGGAWSAGDKASTPALPFAEKGYAVASINYRLSQHALFPAQLEDCKAAVRWLRAHAQRYNLNPDRIGAWGSSAGGHLVALLGTAGDVKELEGSGGHAELSSRVRCVVDFFGPTDFTRMGGSHDGPKSPESRLLGGPVQEHRDRAARANPITYVSKDDAPFLIVHGHKDPVVPHSQSVLLHEALRQAGIDSTLITIEGGGHGGPQFQTGDTARRVAEFFDRHLMAARHTSDSIATIKDAVAAGKALLVDVREKSEWDRGHLRDARLLPLSRLREASAAELKEVLPKDRPVYLHCAAGRRCLVAADILRQAGFDVRPLQQGYEELLKQGLPGRE